MVKPRMVSEEEKQRKAALLAQYADVTDEEEYPFWSLSSISRGSSQKHLLVYSELWEVATPLCSLTSSKMAVLWALCGCEELSWNG